MFQQFENEKHIFHVVRLLPRPLPHAKVYYQLLSELLSKQTYRGHEKLSKETHRLIQSDRIVNIVPRLYP
jgi:hypothetical protein